MDAYLRRFGVWNARKTLCKTSLFTLEPGLVFREEEKAEPAATQNNESSALASSVSLRRDETAESGRGLTCRTCALAFADQAAQQEHFKSDLHVLNMRRKLRGLGSLTFEQVESQTPDAGHSSDEEDGDSDDGEKAEGSDDGDIWLQTDDDINDESSPPPTTQSGILRSALGTVEVLPYNPHQGVCLTFTPNDSLYSITINQLVLSCLCKTQTFSSSASSCVEETHWLRLQVALRAIRQQSSKVPPPLPTAQQPALWCALLLRSGKFAGCIMDLSSGRVLVHKVFRRYTVRAKAGGSQSSYDNKGMKAQSAGATMRRAGERHLREDVEGLLRVWGQQLDMCGTILVSVPRVMRSYVFHTTATAGGDGNSDALLDAKVRLLVFRRIELNAHLTLPFLLHPPRQNDRRIVSIPFMVSKITLDECQSVLSKCSSVWFTRVDPSRDLNAESESGKAESTLFRDLAEDQSEAEFELSNQRRARRADKLRRRNASRSGTEEVVGAEVGVPSLSENQEDDGAEAHWMMALACWLRTGRQEAVVKVVQFLRWNDFCNMRGEVSTARAFSRDYELPRPTDCAPFAVDATEAEAAEALAAMRPAYPELEEITNPADLSTRLLFSLVEPSPSTSGTLLHIAAEQGCHAAVQHLLLAGSAPGLLDGRGRTSYFLSKDKETRDAFRRARAILQSNGVDTEAWDAAGVGPALHPDQEAQAILAQREKEKEKKKRAKDRKRENERMAKDAVTDTLRQQEVQAELLREEARARRAALGSCSSSQCGCSLGEAGVAVVEVFGGRVCSAACAIKFRREQQAAAADKRIGVHGR